MTTPISQNFYRFATYTYAHDMKNILSGLQCSISLLQKNNVQGKQDKYLEMMQKKINLGIHFSRSFDAYLNESYSRNTSSYTFVDSCLEKSIPLIGSIHGEHNEIIVSYDAENTYIDCLEDDFEHIVFNLLSNALKASPKGENVYLTSRKVIVKKKKWVSITIADKGNGIKPQLITEIKKYFDNERAIEELLHLGTGLKITCSLLKKVGAYINIEKNKQGTKISLFFPIIAIDDCQKY